MDDLHLAAVGPRKFLSLWVCIAVFEIVGTPFAYHKFAGGLETQFVGYFLDYRKVAIGVSSKRGKWLLEFLAEFRRNNFTIHMRRFSEFLGIGKAWLSMSSVAVGEASPFTLVLMGCCVGPEHGGKGSETGYSHLFVFGGTTY